MTNISKEADLADAIVNFLKEAKLDDVPDVYIYVNPEDYDAIIDRSRSSKESIQASRPYMRRK